MPTTTVLLMPISCLATWKPMNPAAPVTRTTFVELLRTTGVFSRRTLSVINTLIYTIPIFIPIFRWSPKCCLSTSRVMILITVTFLKVYILEGTLPPWLHDLIRLGAGQNCKKLQNLFSIVTAVSQLPWIAHSNDHLSWFSSFILHCLGHFSKVYPLCDHRKHM